MVVDRRSGPPSLRLCHLFTHGCGALRAQPARSNVLLFRQRANPSGIPKRALLPHRFCAQRLRFLPCERQANTRSVFHEAAMTEPAGNKPHGLSIGLTNYGDPDFAVYLRRSFARSMGYSLDMLERPVVGIAQSASGFNNCHRTMPELVEAVKRGVLAGGALPLEFPTISLGEAFLSPTSLMFRNLMSMDVEEMIRAQPMDAVVLIGGCDKTVPAQLMGAASAGRPAIQLVTGPMITGRYHGQRLGACTDCRGYWARFRAGAVDADEIAAVEGQLAVTSGTCAVMGTASTMACLAEALGMSL